MSFWINPDIVTEIDGQLLMEFHHANCSS
uniref:Uncharacterized protein n=1 Tax=Arundo donax TaxID=35708 RepID=A0A0A8Z937_ARUDO